MRRMYETMKHLKDILYGSLISTILIFSYANVEYRNIEIRNLQDELRIERKHRKLDNKEALRLYWLCEKVKNGNCNQRKSLEEEINEIVSGVRNGLGNGEANYRE